MCHATRIPIIHTPQCQWSVVSWGKDLRALVPTGHEPRATAHRFKEAPMAAENGMLIADLINLTATYQRAIEGVELARTQLEAPIKTWLATQPDPAAART